MDVSIKPFPTCSAGVRAGEDGHGVAFHSSDDQA